jgi:caa(3)-type oxidase subunit IV
MNDRDFRHHLRRLGFAWAALIALMLASLGSSYLSLGIGNFFAGIVIAILKSTIVVALFMGMMRSQALVRIVAAAALGTWCLLLALSSLDQATREREPASMQAPRQLAPTLKEGR